MPSIYLTLNNKYIEITTAYKEFNNNINMKLKLYPYLNYLFTKLNSINKYVKIYSVFQALLFIHSCFKYGIKNTAFAWTYLTYAVAYHSLPILSLYIAYKLYKKNKYPYNIILPILLLFVGSQIQNPLQMFQIPVMKLLKNWERDTGYFSLTHFNTLPSKEQILQSTVMIAPHGPTTIPFPLVQEMIYKEHDILSIGFVAPKLSKLPFITWLTSLTGSLHAITPENIIKYLSNKVNTTILMYPGGIKDVIDNSNHVSDKIIVNLKGLKRLFNYHIEHERKKIMH
jgi:hypothetical protein